MAKRIVNLETLRARVEKLGCQYLRGEADENDVPGLYVSDGRKVVFEWQGDDEREAILALEEFVVQRETDAADEPSEATRDDFNRAAGVRENYEKFLSMIVCAGLKDRLKALRIRKEKGIEAAVEFIGECTLTAEHDHAVDADGLFDLLCVVERIQALSLAIEERLSAEWPGYDAPESNPIKLFGVLTAELDRAHEMTSKLEAAR